MTLALKSRHARSAGVLAAAAALLLAVGSPAHAAPVTLTSGHVDALDVDYASGALTLDLLDETTASAVERAPADVTLSVPVAAKRTNVPSTTPWAFLGTGGTAWILPQSQTSGLLWAGWNTTGVPSGTFQNDKLTFSLTGVSGPAGFSVYTASGSTPTVLFDSGDGLPDSLSVSTGAHTHVNWGFDAAGTYKVTFSVSGVLASTGRTVTTGAKTYTFQVTN
ncbi:choice-of-anchor M domain-containing protein [Streptomyces drozdowiczii]|uniref:Choice-of-anchor M domain-containing protein n=1 Tax=Streptomyces drozdowiczii TaxID=202862 RepID=A0ABY6PLN7_9ACTN|nr:choice-of-anchor M domain-containing protein [Streptomyces drozdowiczii]MCX0247498.1 choice-of-anchor M domain-containing protein [Streptomyces drozdowiczii]UZK53113.1 choice-of-anchor M domain-containing protein [Streptomyces drozdowiczii]